MDFKMLILQRMRLSVEKVLLGKEEQEAQIKGENFFKMMYISKILTSKESREIRPKTHQKRISPQSPAQNILYVGMAQGAHRRDAKLIIITFFDLASQRLRGVLLHLGFSARLLGAFGQSHGMFWDRQRSQQTPNEGHLLARRQHHSEQYSCQRIQTNLFIHEA